MLMSTRGSSSRYLGVLGEVRKGDGVSILKFCVGLEVVMGVRVMCLQSLVKE